MMEDMKMRGKYDVQIEQMCRYADEKSKIRSLFNPKILICTSAHLLNLHISLRF